MRGALFISLFCCSISIILILLVLIAGINKDVLADWFFLKTNTAALQISSRLSNSTFLKDLSELTGADLTGKDQDAASLGLADHYTVSLFSSCGKTNSSTTCAPSQFGYHFNPLSDLKLDNTGLEGSFTEDFVGSISYGSASKFIGIAYIFALLLTVATQGFNLLSCCAPRAIILSVLTSFTATIFLLAGTSTAMAVFIKLRAKFNDELVGAGIKTALGNKPFIVSWTAFALLFLNSLMLCIEMRQAKKTRQRRGVAKSVIDHSGMDKSGGDVKVFAPPKRTKTLQLLKNIGTPWNKHKYAQIDKQTASRGVSGKGHDDKEMLVKRGFGGGEDEDDDEHAELVRGSTRGIPLISVGGVGGSSKTVDTAYEPYRNAPH